MEKVWRKRFEVVVLGKAGRQRVRRRGVNLGATIFVFFEGWGRGERQLATKKVQE